MDDELSLFTVATAESEPALADRETPIAEWQVTLLRQALDARSLTSMADRRKAIEDYAGRPVASLRELTGAEALRVLARIGDERPTERSDGSAWDQRDEDTWIDRI